MLAYTQTDRFPVDSDPIYPVTEPDERDHDRYTAQVWTLHLRVPTPQDVRPTALRILRSGAEALTGHYCGGDSFAEWCEPYRAQDWYAEHGVALHLRFVAPTPDHARVTGAALCEIAGVCCAHNATVSAGGDWAEQLECLPLACTTPDCRPARHPSDPGTEQGI